MTKEQDKQIAEQVMGWELRNFIPDLPDDWCKDGVPRIPVDKFNPTTDANDDHLVLKHIRENWAFSKRMKYLDALQGLISDQIKKGERVHDDFKIAKDYLVFRYELGDYSKAALKILEKTK